MGLVRVYDNGQQVGNEVVWNLGILERNGKRRLRVEVEAKKTSPKATNRVVASFGPNLSEKADADVELRGIPALLMLGALGAVACEQKPSCVDPSCGQAGATPVEDPR